MGKFRRVRRLPALIAAFSLVALVVAAVAIADNLLADGDGLAPVTDNGDTLAFGDVNCDADTTDQVALAVNRNGASGSTNVYKDGSTVTVSAAETASAVDVSFASGDNTISVPSNWGQANNNKKTSDPEFGPPGTVDVNPNGIVTANVKIHPTTTGAGSATITFTGSGVNSSSPPNNTISRDDAITVTWNVTSCDTTPPYVTSVTRDGSTPTNASSVSWTVQFSESVSGVDAGDFGLATSGTISGASVTSVSPAGPASSYTVTASTGSGDGSIGLSLVDNDSIKDGANNPLGTSGGAGDGGFTNQAAYAVDRTVPRVSSVTRDASTPTNASSVSWTVQFSESVSGVGTGDFSLSAAGGISGAAITSVSPAGPASSYTVTASTGAGDGSIGLNLTDDDSIKDAANNPLGTSGGAGDGGFTNQAAYTVDKTAPTITLSTDDDAAGTGWFNIASDTGNDGIKVTASASDASGVADLTCTRNGDPFISRTSAPFSDTQTLSDGTHNVSCTAIDSLGNSTANGSEKTATYKVDLTAPSVSISSPANGTTTIASPLTVNGSASDATGGSGLDAVKVNGNSVSGSLTPSWSYSLTLACGSNSITATANDVAGNSTSTSPAISVTRLCFGLQYLQPLDQSTSTPVTNVGKYGRTIPVKVILSLLGGGAVDEAGLRAYGLTLQIGVNPASCGSGAATDDLEAYADAGQSSAGTNLLRWDSTARQWIYNLDTKAPPGMTMAINSCYRLDVYVSDGTNKVKVSTSSYALFKPVK